MGKSPEPQNFEKKKVLLATKVSVHIFGFLILNTDQHSRDLLDDSRIKLQSASSAYERPLYVHTYCNYDISLLGNLFSDLL